MSPTPRRSPSFRDLAHGGPDAERERFEEEGFEENAGDPVEEGGEDPAAIDPQLERAEGEGMVTEHAKVSAQDPGPEPEPEPEPDHGPEDPAEPDPEHE